MWRGRRRKKSTTHFSKFDNKRDGKGAGRRKIPVNSSFCWILLLHTTDTCHLKSRRYFFFWLKGRAGGGWRDGETAGWLGGWQNGTAERDGMIAVRWAVGDFGMGGGSGGGTGRGGSRVHAEETGYGAWVIMSPCGSEGTYWHAILKLIHLGHGCTVCVPGSRRQPGILTE